MAASCTWYPLVPCTRRSRLIPLITRDRNVDQHYYRRGRFRERCFECKIADDHYHLACDCIKADGVIVHSKINMNESLPDLYTLPHPFLLELLMTFHLNNTNRLTNN